MTAARIIAYATACEEGGQRLPTARHKVEEMNGSVCVIDEKDSSECSEKAEWIAQHEQDGRRQRLRLWLFKHLHNSRGGGW